MDLRERLRTYGAGNAYPFHMPGHKRQKQPGSLFPYDLDITEIDGFDNLHHAEGILAEAMERAAKLWGSRKSFFLVNGSSAGLLAGIRALTKRGDKVLMARGCHRAVYHAVELCGLHPVYMQAAWVEEMQISGSIQPETVEKHLQEHPDCNLVVLTSPTYEGVVSDIAEIAKITHRYGAYLLVDEAHGAHLGFCEEGFPDTAVHLGADVVVQSLHKTLPCPTQTAILHVCTEQVDATEVGRQLSVFQTSSPSYVFMAEMDGCISLLERERVFLRLMKKDWHLFMKKWRNWNISGCISRKILLLCLVTTEENSSFLQETAICQGWNFLTSCGRDMSWKWKCLYLCIHWQ